jgi:hypothetical protein
MIHFNPELLYLLEDYTLYDKSSQNQLRAVLTLAYTKRGDFPLD